MNTPTEFLEGIHAALEKLPEELATTITYQQADLPDFTMPAGIDMGQVDLEPISVPTTQETNDYPDFGQNSADMPDYPSQTGYSLSEAEYPTQGSPGRTEGSDASFPELSGFGTLQSMMPSAQEAEYDSTTQMVGLLEDISRGITNLSRGGGSAAGGFQRSSGPVQTSGRQVYVRDRDDPNGIPNRTLLSNRFENGN